MTCSKKNTEDLLDLLTASGPEGVTGLPKEEASWAAEYFCRLAASSKAHLAWVEDRSGWTAAGLVRLLAWDTKFFRFPCAALEFLTARGENLQRYEAVDRVLQEIMDWGRELGVRFMAIKTPGPDPIIIQALENRGFRLTDNVIALSWSQEALQRLPASLPKEYSYLERVDNPDKTASAFRRLFFDGRFHNDRLITLNTADRLWKKAISNQLRGEAREVLIIQHGGSPVGLAALKPLDVYTPKEGAEVGSLYVLGLLAQYRGQGLGRILLAETLFRYGKRYNRLEVETSTFNRPALRTYFSCGFRLKEIKLSLHWWDRPDEKPI